MRRFTDRDGAAWDIVLGRESWGALYALFVPGGSAPIRQAPLRASAYDAAMQELDEYSTEDLQRLLDASQLKME